MATKSELEQLVSDIKKSTSQVSINKNDEVRVMRSMLNDPDFTIGIYDKTQGYIGQKSPHQEAVKFVKNIVVGTTGLDQKDAEVLANNYEFTKKDANFLINNMRDYLYVYTGTGRKINIIQSATADANIFTREIESFDKTVPDKDGVIKHVTTTPYTKIVCNSRCPKYLSNED